jgi:hypothetical protein
VKKKHGKEMEYLPFAHLFKFFHHSREFGAFGCADPFQLQTLGTGAELLPLVPELFDALLRPDSDIDVMEVSTSRALRLNQQNKPKRVLLLHHHSALSDSRCRLRVFDFGACARH